MLTNLIVKIVACPLLLYIADAMFPQVDYATIGQIIGVGLVIAGIAYFLDGLLLRQAKVDSMSSAVADLAAVTAVVWLSQFVLPGVRITFIGALLTGVLLGLAEYALHKVFTTEGRKTVKLGNENYTTDAFTTRDTSNTVTKTAGQDTGNETANQNEQLSNAYAEESRLEHSIDKAWDDTETNNDNQPKA